MIIDVVAGARPNFMKVAALFAVAGKFPSLKLRLVHTGQHFDFQMSDVFFKDLGLPKPVCHLEVGSASHAVQTAEIMKRYEQWLDRDQPDLCVVVGDVNSTVACALTAVKKNIHVAHVEAGLRSFDRMMPEEINRIITDSISDLLFVTEDAGIDNLKKEGHLDKEIHYVGNVMIDTMYHMLPKAEVLGFYKQLGVESGKYAYMTLHRPSNVDDPVALGVICEQILWLSDQLPVVFSVHPRTEQSMTVNGWMDRLSTQANIRITKPLGYLESLSLMKNACMVVTDSGGIQEETSVLDIPCLTLRQNTERPVTLEKGTNILIKKDWGLFHSSVHEILKGIFRRASPIEGWDGKAGERILKICTSI